MPEIPSDAKRSIAIVTWKDIRNEVMAVNKELGEIIDEINPSDDYRFVTAEYSYGDLFIKNGVAHVPTNTGKLVPISHSSVNKDIQKELFYSAMPLTMMLEKDSEVFIDTGTRAIPINLFHKGDFTGVYETMDFLMGTKSTPIWNFSAGSRSIAMLPKITDKTGLKKLHMAYDIPTTIQIKHLSDHWELFKSIAQDKNFTQPWKHKILFFGEKWITNKHTSKSWDKFKTYIFRKVWTQAMYAIDKFKFTLCWEKFAETISLRRLQPRPYLIDQVKHILSIVSGNFPAFRPIDNSQEAAPTTGLQDAFIEHYALKQYLPTLLHACTLGDTVIKPEYLYYSLSLPTVLEGSPLKETSKTIINDMREIKLLIETLKSYMKDKTNIEVNNIIKNSEVDYFHHEKDMCGEIRLSSEISNEDKAFVNASKPYPSRTISHTSPFFSGCIRLASKKN